MAMLRCPECEPVTVWFSRTAGALFEAVEVHKRWSLKAPAMFVAMK